MNYLTILAEYLGKNAEKLSGDQIKSLTDFAVWINENTVKQGLQNDGRYIPASCPKCGRATAHKHIENL